MLAPSIVKAQTDPPDAKVIFFDNFNNSKNNWIIVDNKHESSWIDSGFFYLPCWLFDPRPIPPLSGLLTNGTKI